MADHLSIWAIYERPTDYPGGYVLREWTDADGVPVPGLAFASYDIEALRKKVRRLGLVRLARMDGDDPAIVETWI